MRVPKCVIGALSGEPFADDDRRGRAVGDVADPSGLTRAIVEDTSEATPAVTARGLAATVSRSPKPVRK
jgi:hypothetical protein